MRYYLIHLSILFVTLLLPTLSSAALINITDTINPEPDIYMSSGSTHQITHDINDDGFDGSTDTVLSAMLNVDVFDDGDYDYNTGYYTRYAYWCGRHGWFGSYHCHYTSRYITTSYGETEYLNVSADDHNLGTYEIDYSPLTFNIDVNDLQNDGLLNVDLTMTSGDGYFRLSNLYVELDRITSDVPEPVTLYLIGAGLLGLGLTRRKKLAH